MDEKKNVKDKNKGERYGEGFCKTVLVMVLLGSWLYSWFLKLKLKIAYTGPKNGFGQICS